MGWTLESTTYSCIILLSFNFFRDLLAGRDSQEGGVFVKNLKMASDCKMYELLL
jgi:hypothetical protein